MDPITSGKTGYIEPSTYVLKQKGEKEYTYKCLLSAPRENFYYRIENLNYVLRVLL